MNLTELDLWIIVAGVLCAVACALLGNFLVLRKMSMMGDAISHAVLPGLAVAFLLTESRSSIPMFIGAAAVGVLTALFTEWVRSYGKVDEGASMGVVFTALFAVGLILIVQAADHVDLDPGCVLYGAIELTPLDTVKVLGWELPRAVAVLSIVLAIDLLVVVLFYKELKISSFDPNLATTLGISARFMHYLLMTLVAVTTVASFESVGSILVVAMLIVPAAAAHLLTDRLWLMIVVSVVLGAASAVLGHLGAIWLPSLAGFESTNTAGMMAVMAGLLFVLAALFAPRHGLVSKIVHRSLLSLRIVREDVLGILVRAEERAGAAVLSVSELREATRAAPIPLDLALLRLRAAGEVVREGAAYRLTDIGRADGQNLLRSHRLWETYLSRNLSLADDHVHPSADQLEHVPHLADELDAALDRPTQDPHASRIPRREG